MNIRVSRTDSPGPGASLDRWLSWQESLHPRSVDLGLERVRQVAERLGLLPWPVPTITVAGTNGKGSTVACIQAGLQASGLRVLAYTSPHLLRYNERIVIDGAPVDDARLVEAFCRIDQARGHISLTYFEFGTLAALWLGMQAGVDAAVLEVGLGGRLDAVNVVDARVAVITRVGLDHTQWLGNDREQIAAEKAGILRPGSPAVCSDPEPPSAVLERAAATGAPLWLPGRDFRIQLRGGDWHWQGGGRRLRLQAGTSPPWHASNLAGALAALDRFEQACGLPLDWPALAPVVADAHPPGRLSRWHGDDRVWLDVGHNPLALEALQPWLEAHGPVHLVFAALADKDLPAMAARLAPWVVHWWLAGLEEVARGLSSRQLMQRLGLGGADCSCHPHPGAALQAALQVGDDRPVLVCGSFHTVAAVLGERADGNPGSGKSG